MTKVTVYRNAAGIWQLWGDKATAVEAELAEGYRVGEGLGGQLCIFGKPGQLGMSADEAVRSGVLQIPMVRPLE